ncbi:WW domain binding protein 1-like b isoform X1 [Pundamilia nyererei]|nr:PREDICTED: WW domain binding protein 1-like isoform X1 [Pundamilia nyererei]
MKTSVLHAYVSVVVRAPFGGMRGECSGLKMGLFLHAVGSVTPTESAAADTSLLHCEGVNNQSYICESGHCCGESQCCSYYYELWWFWLVWAIIFILSCCCVCHHRRTKHRLQQQQRQHEINLIAYREAHNYPSVPFYFRFLPNYLLPEYEEVVNRPPTPPPPYSALQTGPSSVASSPLAPEQQQGHCTAIQPSPVPPVSDSLCCRPTIEEPQPPTLDLRPKPDTKSVQTAQNSGVILLSEGLSREGLANQEKLSESGDDSCKNPLLKDLSLSDGSVEDKERLPSGRRRRITGDSGIEVCVCGTRGSSGCSGAGSTGQESKELRELESLLGHEKADEEEEEAGEFCDSCSHQASFCVEEEQALGEVDRRPGCGPTGSPQPAHQISSGSLNPPLCLLLHTINEQEGPAHSTSTEPQG